MRVLDIDLDIFVTPISNIGCSSRLSNENHSLMNPEEMEDFLLHKCGLSSDSPKPGAIFEEHDQMFDVIRELVVSKKLVSPFELFHVDAHADLGASHHTPFEYLLTDLMHQPITERIQPRRGIQGLNSATVLMFVAACEWISKLVYVHHPDDGDDLPTILLDCDEESDKLFLRMPFCNATTFKKHWENFQTTLNPEAFWDELKEDCSFGNRIHFERTPINSCGDLPNFDYVFLTRSPGFTPPKADAYFDRISSLIRPIGESSDRI